MPFDFSNYTSICSPYLWSRGNGQHYKYTGNLPVYPYQATWALTGFAAADGYKSRDGQGYVEAVTPGGYINSPLSSSFSNAQIFTYEFWIDVVTSTTDDQHIYGGYNGGANGQQWARINNTANFLEWYMDGQVVKTTNNAFANGRYHVVLVKDGTNNCKAYINGSEVSYVIQAGYSGGTKTVASTLGFCGYSYSANFKSKILSIAVNSTALSASRISDNYNYGPDLGGLKGWAGYASHDSMYIGATPISFNLANYTTLVAANSWAKGNGNVNKYTGNIANYPNGDALTLTDFDANTGYRYYEGSFTAIRGKLGCKITSNYTVAHTSASTITYSYCFKYNNSNEDLPTVLHMSYDSATHLDMAYVAKASFLSGIVWSMPNNGGASNIVTLTRLVNGGTYLLHFVKNGTTLKVYVNGVEVSYDILTGYTGGTVTLTEKLNFLGRSYPNSNFTSDMYWFGINSTAFSAQRCLDEYNAGISMGLIANNSSDTLSFTVPSTPVSIPNCRLWLDANDASTVVIPSTKVTLWRDKSGNGSHAVGGGTTGVQYTGKLNGKPVISCPLVSGEHNNLSNNYNWGMPLNFSCQGPNNTFFYVIRKVNNGALSNSFFAVYFNYTGGGVSSSINGLRSDYTALANGHMRLGRWVGTDQLNVSSTKPELAGEWSIATFLRYDGNATIYIDGASNATDTYNELSSMDINSYILSETDGNDAPGGTDFAEILVYNRALTTTEINLVNAYLKNKWFRGAPRNPTPCHDHCIV